MKLTSGEIEYLSAWAREEWEPNCYQLPAHRLQLAQGVPGAFFIAFLKAWTKHAGKKDQDILQAAIKPHPTWPWPTPEEFHARRAQAATSETTKPLPASSR